MTLPVGSLTSVASPPAVAPSIERHRWAMTLAMHHGWGMPDFLHLARHGAVKPRLIDTLARMVGQEASTEHRTELAWLLAYCIERGAVDATRVARAEGATTGTGPRHGWGALRGLGPYAEAPAWWPWPMSTH